MASTQQIQDALALSALADDPGAVVTLSTGWSFVSDSALSNSPLGGLGYSTHGLSYTVYANTSTKQIAIAFGAKVDPSAPDASSPLFVKATLSTGVSPSTLPLMNDAAALALSIFTKTLPGYSGAPIGYDGNGVAIGPGYTVFVTGSGIGGAAAGYAMESVLTSFRTAQNNDLISGIAFGGPGLSNAASFQAVDFTSYTNFSDYFSSLPPLALHIGNQTTLQPTARDLVNVLVEPLATYFGGELAGFVVPYFAEEYIKGATVYDYARSLLQKGIIQSNPLAGPSPPSQTFNFNLNDAFSTLSNYVQSFSPSSEVAAPSVQARAPVPQASDQHPPTPASAVAEFQSGTIAVDGVTQVISFSDYSDGTSDFTISEASSDVQAAETLSFDAAGDLSQNQIVIDGATITTSGTESAALSSNVDGSLTVVFSPGQTALGDFELIANQDGTTELVGVDSSTGLAQEVAKYSPGGIAGDTVNVSELNAGIVDVTTDIPAGDTAVVASDTNISGVSQDFQFGDPDDAEADVLEWQNPTSKSGTILNFLPGDTIDLGGINNATSATLGAGNVLTVFENDGDTISLQLDPLQSFSGVSFGTEPDDSGGTNVVEISSAATSGTQTVTVDVPTTPYSADVAFDPTNIQFPAYRTDEPAPSPVPVTAIFTGGNLDPRVNNVAIDDYGYLEPNSSQFGLANNLSSLPLNSSGTLYVTIDASTPAGDYASETLPLDVHYDDVISGLDLTVSAKVYAPAVPQFQINGSTVTALNFGTIHIGQTVSMDVTIANTATGGLTDSLSSSPETLGQFATVNGVSDIAAGSVGTVTVSMTGENLGPDAIYDARPLLDLVSHDSDLPDEGVGSAVVPIVVGTVYDYADPIFSNNAFGGVTGTLTRTDASDWTLDLGTVALGLVGDVANIEIVNAASSVFTDTLTGTMTLSASADGGFGQVLNSLSGLSADGGDFLSVGVVQPLGDALGTHSETITFDPIGSNDSGFSEALPTETLTITDDVVSSLCFVAGTRIATPIGEVPVERILVGEEVLTTGGAARRIIWVGAGRVLASRGRRDAATPVIVRKGALADNVPHRDLRVTKGHALYFDGVLIPVEFLVNHRSIMWDDHAQEVELYHIELETHDVLLANGAQAESYRDDGNRSLFQNANTGWELPPQQPCAPVLTGGPIVDAVWRRLLERAGPRPGMPLTDDPDLHLLVDGSRIDTVARTNEVHLFRLAARPTILRIVSRSSAPQELGLTRDPRCLGVALRQIVLSDGTLTRIIAAGDPDLTDGFYDFEPDNIRWTNGEATVPAQLFDDFTGPIDLTLFLGCQTRYVDDGMTRQVA